MRRYALRDDQWDRIKHLLPGSQGWVGVTARDNRLFVEAVLYRYRAGIPWRDLPERFGDWKQVHTRLSRWAACGVWHELGEEVLDQVTCLEEVSVIVAANLPVCLRRDDRGLAGGGQWGEDTFISIEGLVGDDGIGLHGWQEVIGAEQIVRLTSGQVAAWLAENGLALHPDKMRIGDSREPGMGFDFLGYRFEAGQRLVRKKSLMALKDKVRSRTGRSRGVSLGRIIDDLNPILRGWFGYFQHATPGVFRAIDGLVRRRLRAILRKQEKRPGFGRCRADHQRWPNAFFAERGLFTLQTAHAQARHSR